MSFTKVKELTVSEALALAFVEFKHERFTDNKLTTYLCALLNDPFKVSSVTALERLLDAAVPEGLVAISPGPRGGAGYRITTKGAAFIQEVELPQHLYARRDNLDDEKCISAKENPGPLLEKVLGLVRGKESKSWRETNFVESVAAYWLKYGWLSRKQVSSVAEIAALHGVYVGVQDYVGASLESWLQPYRDAARRREAERCARAQELKAAREAERLERERARAWVRDANREIKLKLQTMELAGKLGKLDELVSTVFPEANLSASTKSAAFSGSGSIAIRVCVSALAFGKPPSEVWQSAKGKRQPDANSESWNRLVSHPAYAGIS